MLHFQMKSICNLKMSVLKCGTPHIRDEMTYKIEFDMMFLLNENCLQQAQTPYNDGH